MAKQRGWWSITFSVDVDDSDLEHIAKLVAEGYREGEILPSEDCSEEIDPETRKALEEKEHEIATRTILEKKDYTYIKMFLPKGCSFCTDPPRTIYHGKILIRTDLPTHNKPSGRIISLNAFHMTRDDVLSAFYKEYLDYNKRGLVYFEEFVKIAERRTGKENITFINKLFLIFDESHKYPINGKFNATQRAIYRVARIATIVGSCYGIEHATALNSEITDIVNSQI